MKRIVDMQVPKTRVVNIKRSPYDVYIGRPRPAIGESEGYFGNPFHIDGHSADHKARKDCIDKYALWFWQRLQTDEEFKRRVSELKGKVLGCWCKPHMCHGDVIAEYLETGEVRPR